MKGKKVRRICSIACHKKHFCFFLIYQNTQLLDGKLFYCRFLFPSMKVIKEHTQRKKKKQKAAFKATSEKKSEAPPAHTQYVLPSVLSRVFSLFFGKRREVGAFALPNLLLFFLPPSPIVLLKVQGLQLSVGRGHRLRV